MFIKNEQKISEIKSLLTEKNAPSFYNTILKT